VAVHQEALEANPVASTAFREGEGASNTLDSNRCETMFVLFQVIIDSLLMASRCLQVVITVSSRCSVYLSSVCIVHTAHKELLVQ
jgi:hypothetical protein